MERIQLRRDVSTKWTEINPILMEGEVGFEIDTKLRKIGDGVTAWNNLDYLAAENIVQELGDSTTATVSQNTITESFGNYVENEEFIRAYIDNNGRFLFGIKNDGSVDWVKGIPYHIHKIISSKEEKQVGKTLVNSEYASSLGTSSNEEYSNLIVDASNTPLFWIDKNGNIGWAKGVPQPIKDYIKDNVSSKNTQEVYFKYNFTSVVIFSKVIKTLVYPTDSLVLKLSDSLKADVNNASIKVYYENGTTKVLNLTQLDSIFWRIHNDSEKIISKVDITFVFNSESTGKLEAFIESAYGTAKSVNLQSKLISSNIVFEDDFDTSNWNKNWNNSFNFKDRNVSSNNNGFNWSNYDNLPELIHCENSILHLNLLNKRLLPNPSIYPMTYVGAVLYGEKSLLLYEGIIRVKAKVIYSTSPYFTTGLWTLTKNQVNTIDFNGVPTLFNWPRLNEFDILETSLDNQVNLAYNSVHLVNNNGYNSATKNAAFQTGYGGYGYDKSDWHIYTMSIKDGIVSYFIDDHFIYDLDVKEVSQDNIFYLQGLRFFVNAKSTSDSTDLDKPVELQIDWVKAYSFEKPIKAESFILKPITQYIDNIIYPTNISYKADSSISNITLKKDHRFALHSTFTPYNTTNQACNFKAANSNIVIFAPDRDYELNNDSTLNFTSIVDWYIVGITVGSTQVTCTCADGIIQTFTVTVVE